MYHGHVPRQVLVDDLIPYGLALGNRASLHGLNLRGVRRLAVPGGEQRAMLRAYRYVFQARGDGFYAPLRLPALRDMQERARLVPRSEHPRVAEMVAFVLGQRPHLSLRALCRPAA